MNLAEFTGVHGTANLSANLTANFFTKGRRETDDSAQPPAREGITEVRDFSPPQRTVNNSE